MSFQLAACAEMLWEDKPIDWRAARLNEMGFGVGLWNWPVWDLDKLEATGATFTIMNGYLEGRLADDEGADRLLKSARETAQVGKRLGVHRVTAHPLNEHNSLSSVKWSLQSDNVVLCDCAWQVSIHHQSGKRSHGSSKRLPG